MPISKRFFKNNGNLSIGGLWTFSYTLDLDPTGFERLDISIGKE